MFLVPFFNFMFFYLCRERSLPRHTAAASAPPQNCPSAQKQGLRLSPQGAVRKAQVTGQTRACAGCCLSGVPLSPQAHSKERRVAEAGNSGRGFKKDKGIGKPPKFLMFSGPTVTRILDCRVPPLVCPASFLGWAIAK